MIAPARLPANVAMLCLCACASVSQPAVKLTGGWVVEDIAGRGIIDSSRIELLFEDDGRLSGLTGCNLLNGRYHVDDTYITIDVVALPRKTCPEALTNQDRALLGAIRSIESYRIDPTGTLVLHHDDQPVLLARADEKRP